MWDLRWESETHAVVREWRGTTFVYSRYVFPSSTRKGHTDTSGYTSLCNWSAWLAYLNKRRYEDTGLSFQFRRYNNARNLRVPASTSVWVKREIVLVYLTCVIIERDVAIKHTHGVPDGSNVGVQPPKAHIRREEKSNFQYDHGNSVEEQ